MEYNAFYFDGLISVANGVFLTLTADLSFLTFTIPGGKSVSWKLDDLEVERYGSVFEIRNRQFPDTFLKVVDEQFADDFYQIMRKSNNLDFHTKMVNLGFGKVLLISSAIIALIILSCFFLVPILAERFVFFIPESVDDSVGRSYVNSILEENEVDTLKTRYLREFAAQLDLGNTKPLQLSVVKYGQVNAFASPNGHIVIYTGLLRKMKSSDELIALLGHEVSHINHRHSIKQLARNLSGYMLVSLLFSDVNSLMAVVADHAEQLQQLSYSRGYEQQADESGLDIMIRNNADPRGMIDLFRRLKDGGDLKIPEILSTHPLTDDRMSHIEEMISAREYEVRRNEVLDSLFLRMLGTSLNP